MTVDSKHETPQEGQLARASEILPGMIHLLPVTTRPFFPGQAVPLLMDAKHWTPTFKAVDKTEHKIVGVLLARSAYAEKAEPEEFARIGTACRVHRIQTMEGKLQVLVECLQRFRLEKIISDRAPFSAQVRYYPENAQDSGREVKAYAMAVINTIKELLPLNPLYAEELRMFLDRFGPEDPSHLADFAASLTTSNKEQLQGVLESVELLPRMEKVLVLLNNELELARAQAEIRKVVEDKMQTQQREFFLREQLKVIQKELGISKDDRTADIDRFAERLEELDLPEAAGKRVDEEMDKLSILETGSPEYALTRNYLDWLTLLPWGNHSQDNLDLEHARKTLDKDHYGLEDVKKRILEFLAVGILKGEVSGSIVLLVGPPGVGKTSLGKSIADTLGRSFYRFSVGGIRDEAEIKGHRRTYIGAMPGKFIQALKEAGTANPVIMLDEIDKVGASYHGDPASALLEVLDPEQNSDFLDHYLDVRFDLSKALFICTANQLDTIPRPLLDRMEVIPLSGYIASEKLQIARKYLLPRQIKRSGLKRGQLKIAAAALRAIIDGYARDAGVRRLEKTSGRDRPQDRGQDPGRREPADRSGQGRPQGIPGQSDLPRRAQIGRSRGGHGPGLDRHGRRNAERRGGQGAQFHPRPQAHRSTRRGDAGIRRDRLWLRDGPCRRLRGRSAVVQRRLYPLARSRRRHSQRRPQCRRDHGQRPALPGPAAAGAPHRHDRRTDPDRPGISGRRHPREGDRGPARRHPRVDSAGGQPGRLRGSTRAHPQGL